MSEKWLHTQLHHKVSATATDVFWKVALNFWPKMVEAKANEDRPKKTPLFQNQRNILYKRHCPKVQMQFGFLNVKDGSILKICSTTTPKMMNPDYVRLYEEAHIKVNMSGMHVNNRIIYVSDKC